MPSLTEEQRLYIKDTYPEYEIAKAYSNKIQNAVQRNIEFDLTLAQFKKIYARKTCYYTGINLTKCEMNSPLKYTDRTIDRIDSSKGYVVGNVVVCCHKANLFKATLFENPMEPDFSFAEAMKMMKLIQKNLK